MWHNLKKRNWQGTDICTLCMADDETNNYIFLNYTFSSRVWTLLALCLRLNLPQLPESASLFWSSWRCESVVKRDRVLWIWWWRPFSGGFRGKGTRKFIMACPDRQTKHSTRALPSFLVGAIYFLPETGSGRNRSFNKVVRGASQVANQRKPRDS